MKGTITKYRKQDGRVSWGYYLNVGKEQFTKSGFGTKDAATYMFGMYSEPVWSEMSLDFYRVRQYTFGQFSRMKRCFHIDPADNVATLLEECGPEVVAVVGATPGTLDVLEPVAHGHKVAVAPIACEAPVIKYGVPIGIATRDIRPGGWVHLHNCRSAYDTRDE